MENKVIIITGTRKGLGFALAKYYLDKGYVVCGCSRRNSDFSSPNYIHFNVDVSREEEVVAMVRDIYKKYKRVDILINNAGVASMNHFLLTPFSTVERVFGTNYSGTFLMCREVAKLMMRQKNGRIINYSTVAVPLNLQGELVYSSSKAAIEQLTKVLAEELGVYGITVNAVGPTPIATDLIKNVPQEKIDKLIERQSVHRLGSFEDLLNVIEFFVSPRSNFITGQIIYLGGVN